MLRGKTFVLKALLTGASTSNGVFGLSDRDGLLFEKKNPLAVFTHREIPHLTSHLMTWHTCCVHRKYLSSWREETETAIEETCSPYFEEFHGGEEGRWGERGKNIPQTKCWLKKGCHGKILIFHARKQPHAPQKHRFEKTRICAKYKGYMKQVEARGEKQAVFFQYWPEKCKVNDRIPLTHTSTYGCVTSLPLLQCLIAILHILDSAMVGQGIVSLGGFFTMCRVRVSRPHL